VNKIAHIGPLPYPKNLPPSWANNTKKANNPHGYMLSLATWHHNSTLNGTSTGIGLPKQNYYRYLIVGGYHEDQTPIRECHPFLPISFQLGLETMIEEHVSHGGHIHLLLCPKLNLSQQSLFHGHGCIGELNPLF
jgi:hypothetical protein